MPGAAAPAAPTPETAALGAPSGAAPVPAPETGGQADGAGAAGGIVSGAELQAGQGGAGKSGPGREAAAGAEVPVPAAATQAAAAPQEAGGRVPQAAGVPGNPAQSVGAVVRSQQELEASMVGLGLGLVGLAATAAGVYLRMRKP